MKIKAGDIIKAGDLCPHCKKDYLSLIDADKCGPWEHPKLICGHCYGTCMTYSKYTEENIKNLYEN